MTEHWERVAWDRGRLEAAAAAAGARRANGSGAAAAAAAGAGRGGGVEWLLDGRVARLPLLLPRTPPAAPSAPHQPNPALFLVPMHGGIWTLCVALSQEQQALLQLAGFAQPRCLNYLAPELARREDARTDWQHRMQNLSISCALVCLIILAAAAVVGAFGVLRHQISAVLVTGVMYLLAATFAMFTLTIIHFKRQQAMGRNEVLPDCISTEEVAALMVDGVSPSADALQLGAPRVLEADFLSARVFSAGWSLQLGWGGVALCAAAAVLWLLLSKIMRYSPLSSLLA